MYIVQNYLKRLMEPGYRLVTGGNTDVSTLPLGSKEEGERTLIKTMVVTESEIYR